MPILWSIDPATLAVTRHEPTLDTGQRIGVGFTVLRYFPTQRAYLAVDGLHGKIWHIDASLKTA